MSNLSITDKVELYLKTNRRITKMYASKELDTDAVKDHIYILRRRGMCIQTVTKIDFGGSKYTEWKLVR